MPWWRNVRCTRGLRRASGLRRRSRDPRLACGRLRRLGLCRLSPGAIGPFASPAKSVDAAAHWFPQRCRRATLARRQGRRRPTRRRRWPDRVRYRRVWVVQLASRGSRGSGRLTLGLEGLDDARPRLLLDGVRTGELAHPREIDGDAHAIHRHLRVAVVHEAGIDGLGRAALVALVRRQVVEAVAAATHPPLGLTHGPRIPIPAGRALVRTG